MDNFKKFRRRLIAFVFAVATSASFIPQSAFAAEDETAPAVETEVDESTDVDTDGEEDIVRESVYEGDGYRATFQLDGIWDGGFCANVTIENTGEEAIEDWIIGFDYPGEISGFWNADFLSTEAGNYIAKNNEWNQDIPVGGSITFSIIGGEDFVDFPTEYHMMSRMSRRDTEEYEVSYEVTQSWESAFNANVTITNNSETDIEDWMLEFDFNADIINIWNGEILSGDDGHYVIKNSGYNSVIPAGESITFGVNAAYAEEACEPENYQLYSFGMSDDETDETDMQTVMNAYSKLKIGFAEGNDANSVTSDITLCTELEGATITWISTDPDVISDTGAVTRSDETKNVSLKAVIQCNDYSMEADFTVRVIKNTYEDYDTDFLYDMDSLELLYIYNDDPDDLEIYLSDDGYIADLNGRFSQIVVESPDEALLSLYEVKSLMGCDDPKTQLEWEKTSFDSCGYSYKFHQVIDGIPVYGQNIVVSTDTEGNTTALHSKFIPQLSVDTADIISEADAQTVIEDAGYSFVSSDGLVIYTKDGIKPAYNINCLMDGKYYNLLVDAHTGDILLENLRSVSEVISASGNDEFGVNQTFSANKFSIFHTTFYTIDDPVRNLHYHDLAGSHDHSIWPGDPIVKFSNTWTTGEVSAIVSANHVYDYYLETLHRNGFDNENGEFHVSINLGENNSYSSGAGNNIVFGQRGGSYTTAAQAGIDTVGHEFTHSVVADETDLNLNYNDAPGAINEGYADIFGYFAEGDNDPDWNHGEDNHAAPIRVMSNPNLRHMPTGVNDTTYFYDFNVAGNTFDHGGVHTNNSVISYPCYLMWANGISDKDRLAALWYKSLLYGYDSDAEFDDVRVNVLRAAKAMRMSGEEIQIIKDAFDTAGITGPTATTVTGTNVLFGKVVEADLDTIAGNNTPLAGSLVTLNRSGSSSILSIPTAFSLSDTDGTFKFYDLRPGTYTLTVSHAGYISTSLTMSLVSARMTNYCDTIELIPTSYEGVGTASGTIKDSVTGSGVSGMTLRVRSGMNNKTGTILTTLTTGTNGNYTLSQDAGHYCIEVIDQRTLASGEKRYLKTYFNVKILGGKTIANQNATVSHTLDSNQLRIVLEWGRTPYDLDSHLIGPKSDGTTFHIYFGYKQYWEDTTEIADLDLDDTNSYGPETTTLYNPISGDYSFYVYNFSGSPSITSSGATVKVFTGNSNEPAYTFSVPLTGNGGYWNVFTYNSRTRRVTPVNTVSTSPVTP